MSENQICRNCGCEVSGNYCSECGQRTSTHRLGWKSLAESFASTFIGDEAYGLQGINMRKSALETWWAILTQPHVAIPEFISGHRRKYFNPVAILLLLSTLYSVFYYLIDREYTPLASADQGFLLWCMNTYRDYAQLHPAVQFLIGLPFFTFALKTVFRKRTDYKFVEMLYVGIFLSIFEISLMLVLLPIELRLTHSPSPRLAVLLPHVLYNAFVFRNMFRLKWGGALLRSLYNELLYFVYFGLTLFAVVFTILFCIYFTSPETFRELNEETTIEKGSPEAEGPALRETADASEEAPLPTKAGTDTLRFE